MLLLVSGRPGAGKTAFGNWLRDNHGFVHIESDTEWEWARLLCGARRPAEAAVTAARARARGQNVVVEWGFPTPLLECVRHLRQAGFDTWWFDGEEDALRYGYVKRRGVSRVTMETYWNQVNTIGETWPQMEAFYGDHVVRTVASGPTYLPFEEIASRVLSTPQGAVPSRT